MLKKIVQPISATNDAIGNSSKLLYRPYRDGKSIDLDAEKKMHSTFLPLAILLTTAKKICTGHIEMGNY